MNDLLLDENGDIQFDENGDITLGESEQQDVELILATRPGDWKEHPSTGVNIGQFIKSREAHASIAREVNLQLKEDGFKVSKVEVDYPNIHVDAIRKL